MSTILNSFRIQPDQSTQFWRPWQAAGLRGRDRRIPSYCGMETFTANATRKLERGSLKPASGGASGWHEAGSGSGWPTQASRCLTS